MPHLTVGAFTPRAERLMNYLGEKSIAANQLAITALIEQRARTGSFEEFRIAMSRCLFGVVFTAHPAFSVNLELAHKLAELATGHTLEGVALDQTGREAHLAAALHAEHRPPVELSLEVEHSWVTEALSQAHDALEGVHRTALRVAREHWPDQWTSLEPRLITLASWVGYDQDGRTDLTWTRTITARLVDKLAMLERYRAKVESLRDLATDDFLRALEPLAAMLATASATVADQLALVEAANRDASKTAAFGRAMVAGREQALVETRAPDRVDRSCPARGSRRRSARGAAGDALEHAHARPRAGAYPCAAELVAVAQRGAPPGGTRDGTQRSGESAVLLQHHQRSAGAGAADDDQLRLADGRKGLGQTVDDDRRRRSSSSSMRRRRFVF